jgi:hypothetical protein
MTRLPSEPRSSSSDSDRPRAARFQSIETVTGTVAETEAWGTSTLSHGARDRAVTLNGFEPRLKTSIVRVAFP